MRENRARWSMYTNTSNTSVVLTQKAREKKEGQGGGIWFVERQEESRWGLAYINM